MAAMTVVDSLLEEYGVQPVLVDIGASGGSPEMWRPLARHSTYVGFDPDLREIRRDTVGGYKSGIVINKAVCPDPSARSVTFYLTESPYCSSMLKPDQESLSMYSFWRLFEVKSTIAVSATTLNRVIAEERLSSIDWLKIDSQGADLRIYRSIDEPLRHRMIAVDTEPGLLDAYRGEDLFPDVHKHLTEEGFWLSNLSVMGIPRISRSVLDALEVNTAGGLPVLDASPLRKSPGWCEARYLRTTAWLQDTSAGEREFLLAWSISVLDGQYGHALEIARTTQQALPRSPLGTHLWNSACTLLRAGGDGAASKLGGDGMRLRSLRKIGRIVRRVLRL